MVYPLLVINLLGIGLNILLHQTFMVWMNIGLMYNFVDLTKIIVNIYNIRKILQTNRGSSISINITGYFILLGILAYIYISKIYVNTWTGYKKQLIRGLSNNINYIPRIYSRMVV